MFVEQVPVTGPVAGAPVGNGSARLELDRFAISARPVGRGCLRNGTGRRQITVSSQRGKVPKRRPEACVNDMRLRFAANVPVEVIDQSVPELGASCMGV